MTGTTHHSPRSMRQVATDYLRMPWVGCFLLAVLGFAVRVPALQGQLIWDDQFLAGRNPFMKSPLFILEVFRHYLFLDSFSTHYRPVQNLSLMADYFLWNNNTYGFHLTNVLLHASGGVLLYLLLRKLFVSLFFRAGSGGGDETKSPELAIVALCVALLWTVHPIHSAAVDYISGRADSLSFAFACGAWLLILKGREAAGTVARRVYYSLSMIAGLLALCSREIACIWLIIFVLHLCFFEKAVGRRAKGITLIFCLGLIAIYAGLRQLPQERKMAPVEKGWSKPVRAVLMLRALGDYGQLIVFPSKLHMERTVFNPENYRNRASWRKSVASEYLSLAGLGVLSLLIVASCRRGVGQPVRVFGTAWFLLSYLPISNIVDLNATSAEHWLYLPSVGFLLFLAGCALDFPPRARKATMAVACLAVIGLSVRSAVRSSDWVNPETFYERTLAAGGTSPRVLVNLAQIYSARGDHAKAEGMFRKVLEVTPDYPTARNNLANVLSRQGKPKEAEELFLSSSKESAEKRKEYPRTWIAALQLARMRRDTKEDLAAIEILEKARLDYPHVWELISFESEIVRETQGPEAAMRLVEDFAARNWWHYDAALALGRLYAQQGDVERASAALLRASRLDIREVEALNLIAVIRWRQNRLEDACTTQRRAVARQPHEPQQYKLLASFLEQLGRKEEARAATLQVARLQAIVDTQTAVN